ncbi:MAG: hypothetical protein JWP68_1804 [Modestobacter sp.]|nr:hypothetical protein [Modestobacter sp.]
MDSGRSSERACGRCSARCARDAQGAAPPRGSPVRRREALGHVDGLARYLLAAELQDVDAPHRLSAVVADRQLRDPDVAGSPNPADVHVDPRRRLVPPPAQEVRDTLEALAGLGELQNGVRCVHGVRGVLGAGRAEAEVPLNPARTAAFSMRPRSSPAAPRGNPPAPAVSAGLRGGSVQGGVRAQSQRPGSHRRTYSCSSGSAVHAPAGTTAVRARTTAPAAVRRPPAG